MAKKKQTANLTQEKAFAIVCQEIATTSKGLDPIISEQRELYPDFPCRKTLYSWMNENELYRQQFEFAKRLQVQSLIDEIIEIADDSSQDWQLNDKEQLVPNKEHIQRSRVRIDTRKWLAAKLRPTLYGDGAELREVLERQQVEITELKKKIGVK
jgi:hypothetical protein